MFKDRLFLTGIVGTITAAACCFTPLLVVLFAALGVSAWLAWIDLVLWPALLFFLALSAFAVFRRSRTTDASQT
jgi:mercuric ion transport protein